MMLSKDKSRQILFILLLILTLFWTAFIFSNSLKDGEQSKAASGKVVEVVEKAADVIGIEIKETGDGLTLEGVSLFVRKSAHILEFAVLGFLSFLTVSFFVNGTKSLLSLLYPLVAAVTDELLQLTSPGRSCQLTDVLIDMAGATVATLIAYIVVRIHKSRTAKSCNTVKSEKVKIFAQK